MALTDVVEDSRGNRLYVEENEVGGHRYWSDEIGGGVVVWDTSLVSAEMLRLALAAEWGRTAKNNPPVSGVAKKKI